MSDRVAFLEGRALPRLALTALALIWLAGCSADVSRFDQNPFSNPFGGSPTAQATPSSAAPAGQVSSAPLAPPGSVASASLPPASGSAASQAVGGSAAGWSASGGTPVVVGSGETLDTLSRRYGVPSAALLSTNGLASASDVKGGMRLVVPVYSAGGKAVASRAPADAAKAKKSADAGESSGKEKSGKDKTADKSDASKQADAAKPGKADLAKSDAAKSESAKSESAKTDAPKTAEAKKQGVDNTPTANIDPKAASAKEPVTSAEADASGSNPEFRWPARGRIIQGFKAGGNDGIDISVPAGTSVRAAENGVVVYSGDGLKGYGNLVLIKHPNGYVTAYANNGELDVKRGEQVKRGQIIAKSGDTGNVNAPQLHFELRKGSTPVDPTSYLAGL
jgi:murein DD-endopeptidase MepM/ murein hydrolase activator NlpD